MELNAATPSVFGSGMTRPALLALRRRQPIWSVDYEHRHPFPAGPLAFLGMRELGSMNDPRMEQWRQRLEAVKRCHTPDEVVGAFGSPEHKVPERDREIWHYPLGVVGGSLYSIHIVTCKGALQEAYLHAAPAGEYVQQGTAAELELIRRCRRILWSVWRTYLAVAFVGFMILCLADAAPIARKVFGFTFIFGGVALIILGTAYWRCPVCRHEFSRQSAGKYCEHCKTKFGD